MIVAYAHDPPLSKMLMGFGAFMILAATVFFIVGWRRLNVLRALIEEEGEDGLPDEDAVGDIGYPI